MTYNEKKSLYESIMKEVAKIVKHHLNESDNKFRTKYRRVYGAIDYFLQGNHDENDDFKGILSKCKITKPIDDLDEVINHIAEDAYLLYLQNHNTITNGEIVDIMKKYGISFNIRKSMKNVESVLIDSFKKQTKIGNILDLYNSAAEKRGKTKIDY